MRYFCDTYALVEIIRGNKFYQRYLSEELYTSILNMYELVYNLLKEYDEETVKDFFYGFMHLVIPIKDDYLFTSAKFKLKHAKANISYTDALGYSIAQTEGMKFLTGDKEFDKFEDVEFVK